MATTAEPQQAPVPSFRRLEPGSVNILPHKFKSTSSESADPKALAKETVDALNAALTKEDVIAVADLFADESYWRDHLALSWDVRTFAGRAKIKEQLTQHGCNVTSITIDDSSAFRAPHFAPFDGAGKAKGIEFFITFNSKIGSGRGTCRLFEENGKWKVFSLFTGLREIKGHEPTTGPHRPNGVEHGGKPDRKNWVERRTSEKNYDDNTEPTVLIIGAGQGGLTAAARLKILGVDALLIDRNERIGDNWRKRYHQLVLHDPVWYDHMPYLPFPEHWPIFTPKDKLGDWFNFYAEALELNVWMRTTLTSSSWSDSEQKWTVSVERTLPDGSKQSRTFHPRHVIQATGHSGKKNFPSIKGMDNFKGARLCHSSEFSGAKPNGQGKKAVVVGCCNSGHDISQTFYENGYDVTMVQRSSTCVVSSESITKIALGGVYCEGGPPVEDADTWLHGTPMPVLKLIQVAVTAASNDMDKATLEGLRAAGFKLDTGPDGGGLFMKYYQRGGGYYIDVGASQLIVDGKIKIKQGQEIAEVVADGLVFADGSKLEADEIIFATGYQNMRSEARSILGDELADRVGDIWGFDEEGEMRTIWRPSGHPGFWFMGGNLALCRYFSHVVALQIKAREIGLNKA